MSQNLPSVLPLHVTAANNPAALTVTPQNQPVGAQNLFANLLVAQFKERGLMLDGLGALNLAQRGQPVQELPQSGKPLPVALPVADDLMHLLQTGSATDALPVTIAAASERPASTNLLDVALRSAIQATSAGKSAAPVAVVANGNVATATSDVPRQNILTLDNELRAPANERALLAQLTADAKAGAATAGVVFDPLPDLLAQKLAPRPDGLAAVAAAIHGQPGTGLLSQGAGASSSLMAQTPAPSVFVPIDHADWGHELGERVRWLVTQNIQTADIRLNPPELGPVRVHISIDQAQVSVTFTSHHSVVRDALQSAMANLSDMLAESGLNLAQGNVADQSPGEQYQAERDDAEFDLAFDDESLIDAAASGRAGLRTIGGHGLIDQYV